MNRKIFILLMSVVLALGSVGLGVLVFYVFYGDAQGLTGYDIHEKFDDANDVSVNVSSQNLSIVEQKF